VNGVGAGDGNEEMDMTRLIGGERGGNGGGDGDGDGDAERGRERERERERDRERRTWAALEEIDVG